MNGAKGSGYTNECYKMLKARVKKTLDYLMILSFTRIHQDLEGSILSFIRMHAGSHVFAAAWSEFRPMLDDEVNLTNLHLYMKANVMSTSF